MDLVAGMIIVGCRVGSRVIWSLLFVVFGRYCCSAFGGYQLSFGPDSQQIGVRKVPRGQQDVTPEPPMTHWQLYPLLFQLCRQHTQSLLHELHAEYHYKD